MIWSHAHDRAFETAFAGMDTEDKDRDLINALARDNASDATWEPELNCRMIGPDYFGLEITGTDADAALFVAVETAIQYARGDLELPS